MDQFVKKIKEKLEFDLMLLKQNFVRDSSVSSSFTLTFGLIKIVKSTHTCEKTSATIFDPPACTVHVHV